MKITSNPDRSFLNQTFTVEMTGEELVRLYDLSMVGEGGERHARTGGHIRRLHLDIAKQLPDQDLEGLRSRLSGGVVK